MVIWKTVHIVIEVKINHIRKIGKPTHRSFIRDYGDIPIARFNEVTCKFEDVINNRGMAYAARNRLSYRKRRSRNA